MSAIRVRSTVAAVAVVSCLLCGLAQGATLFVKADASGVNDGTSWTDAFDELQSALAVAVSGDQIWVAAGTYKPDYDAGSGTHTLSVSAAFQLKNDVSVHGGFAGNEDPATFDLSTRDFAANETILSGDLLGDDEPDGVNYSDNSMSVVLGSGTNNTALLSGFTISHGGRGVYNSAGSPTVVDCIIGSNHRFEDFGAGMSNYSGSCPVVTRCRFTDNRVNTYPDSLNTGGGGMANLYSSNPVVTDCVFKDNVARYGGGVCNLSSNPVFQRCLFEGNEGRQSDGILYLGGGAGSELSSAVFVECTFTRNRSGSGGGAREARGESSYINCRFEGNEAVKRGGGLSCRASISLLANCVFVGNTADSGGALDVAEADCRPTLVNCTLASNAASHDGSAVYCWLDGTATLTNCVIWDTLGVGGLEIAGLVTMSQSCIQNGYAGTGNIAADPLFVRSASSGLDGIWGTADDDYGDLQLQAGSPCIDAGDNAALPIDAFDLDGDGDVTEPIPFDLAGTPRFLDDPFVSDTGLGTPPIVDMGAYEANHPLEPAVIFVKADATGANNGTSWSDAFNELQSALAVAVSGDQIWVAAGTYKPDYDVNTATHTGNRELSFQLKNGVAVYGGFDTSTVPSDSDEDGDVDQFDFGYVQTCQSGRDVPQTDPDCLDARMDNDDDVDDDDVMIVIACISGSGVPQTDPACGPSSIHHRRLESDAPQSILSGDLAGNDGPDYVTKVDNSYHVVTGNGTDATAVLDGVTITAGNANGSGDAGKGGGAFVSQGSPAFVDCGFTSNSASAGGGVAIAAGAPTLISCTFLRNSANNGAGVHNDQASPSLSLCVFRENSNASQGTCMYNQNGSSPVFVRCILESNGSPGSSPHAVCNGPTGAVSSLQMVNCVLRGNQGRAVQAGPVFMTGCLIVGNTGGGVYCARSSSIVNCTIADNAVNYGGYGLVGSGSTTALTVTNSVIWGNRDGSASAQLFLGSGATASVNFCCMQGWTGSLGGVGNTGHSPRFVDADGADDTYGTADDDLRLGDGSSCIDAGSNAAVPADTYDLDEDGDTDELLPLDVAGESRLIDVPLTPDLVLGSGTIVDMGALEASDPPQSSAVSIVYVDGSAAGAGDGTSWTDAFTDLQAALAAARAINDKEAIELWVAAGTYKPAGPGGGRNVAFELADKLQLYGGFGGGQSTVFPGGETRRAFRDPAVNVTTLSGDLNGDDGPDFACRDDNSYNVLIAIEAGSRVIVDGFSIVSACNTLWQRRGGGLLIDGCGEAAVSNCRFSENQTASTCGAGLYAATTSLTITNCGFTGNQGGYVSSGVNDGGALCVGSCPSARIANCMFAWNEQSSLVVNSSSAATSLDVANCTFGGDVSGFALATSWSATIRLSNSILWGPQSATRVYMYAGSLTVDHSNVRGGRESIIGGSVVWGDGNIDVDPRFVLADEREWDVSGRVNLRLAPDSPCIDAGRNSAMPILWDADGNPRFIDDAQVADSGEGTPPIVDMGAYEFAGLAITVSPTTVEVPEGQTATFAVALDRDPAGPVEVYVSRISGDADLTLASASTLQFDSGNWATAQTVTLAAAEDGDKAEAQAIFRVSSPGLALVDVAAWEVENDVPSPLYVKKGATGGNHGSSWANAFGELRDALTVARLAPRRVKQVWVAAGIYTPVPPGGDQTVYFEPVADVGIYGGFAGDETTLSQRDPAKNITVLSGDLSGNDTPNFGNRADNSNHVVVSLWPAGEKTVLDGFTIRGGRGGQTPGSGHLIQAPTGGGVSCYDSDFTLANCLITDNECSAASSYEPFADYIGGGGLYVSYGSPRIVNCTFVGNSASVGGGVSIRNGQPLLLNCRFLGNKATFQGSELEVSGGAARLTNCLLLDSPLSSKDVDCGSYGHIQFESCTLGGGQTGPGWLLYCRASVVPSYLTGVTADDCIFWGPPIYALNPETVTIRHSNVRGGWPGEGNIDADPLFVDADGPDDLSGTADDDLRLRAASPCIDAGDNAAVPADTLDLDGDGDVTEPIPFDLAGVPRFLDDPFVVDTGLGMPPIVDMGAYEYFCATLESSNPATGRSLWRNKRNIIRLTFDADIAAPEAGAVMIQEMTAGGAYGDDLSAGFTFTVEDDGQGQPRVLRIRETGSSLTHRKWYAVRNTGAWAGVAPFTVQYVVQVGDANNDGRVLNTDFGWVNAAIPTFDAADDDRRDINGDGRILNTDFGVLNSKIPSFPVAKPSGH